PVNHKLGIRKVKDAMSAVAAIINRGGGIVLTDNVICEENKTIVVRALNNTEELIHQFLEHYPSKKIDCKFIKPDMFTINNRDFCGLQTQYNKLKVPDKKRWNVERMEIHQYFTLAEYQELFTELGFELHAITGLPREAYDEWTADFEIIKGLEAFPDK